MMPPKKKKTNRYTAKFNRRMGVVTSTSKTRHIATSQSAAVPICGEPGGWGSWTASASPKTHGLPICKKCEKLVERLHSELRADPGWVAANTDADQLLEQAKNGFLSLLEEYADD
jgi:hypothetical protein